MLGTRAVPLPQRRIGCQRCRSIRICDIHYCQPPLGDKEKNPAIASQGIGVKEAFAVGDCEALEVLDVSGTRIARLPDSIGRCERLREFSVSCTSIATLPETLEDCERLGRVDVPSMRVVLPSLRRKADFWPDEDEDDEDDDVEDKGEVEGEEKEG